MCHLESRGLCQWSFQDEGAKIPDTHCYCGQGKQGMRGVLTYSNKGSKHFIKIIIINSLVFELLAFFLYMKT